MQARGVRASLCYPSTSAICTWARTWLAAPGPPWKWGGGSVASAGPAPRHCVCVCVRARARVCVCVCFSSAFTTERPVLHISHTMSHTNALQTRSLSASTTQGVCPHYLVHTWAAPTRPLTKVPSYGFLVPDHGISTPEVGGPCVSQNNYQHRQQPLDSCPPVAIKCTETMHVISPINPP